uniref:Uncharacterized protein n=1 Tax=Strongyloides venezuelensis TaxID=75913 RepID=A0A0K0FR30_STRVS
MIFSNLIRQFAFFILLIILVKPDRLSDIISMSSRSSTNSRASMNSLSSLSVGSILSREGNISPGYRAPPPSPQLSSRQRHSGSFRNNINNESHRNRHRRRRLFSSLFTSINRRRSHRNNVERNNKHERNQLTWRQRFKKFFKRG